jgi:S-adenosyl-L-methionine hydrolase (adenosine-forming)
MPPRFDTISFLSDYGTSDEFVGVVKSVIRSIAPGVTVVDITHDVRPYDLKGGAFTLARAVQYLCPGVVLAVVDPGVGTDRRAIAIEVGDGQSYLVGPDNGLLASAVGLVGGATGAVELTDPEYQLAAPGPTFAGRDIFGPAAAHLCAGVPLDALGPRVDPAELVPGLMPLPRDEDGAIVGEILWVDRYGNCQLNVDPEAVDTWGERVQLRWPKPRPGVRSAVRAGTYGAIGPGQVGLVVDSYGLLAVSVRNGSAAEALGLEAGDELSLVPLDDGPDEPDASAAGPADAASSAAPSPGDQPAAPAGNGGVSSPVTLHSRKPR